MIKTGSNTPIISACNRLIWTAGRQTDVMELIDRIATIDDAVKRSVLAGAPPIRFKDLDIRSGHIDGIIDIPGIGPKLLYVAVSFDGEPLDAHLLHAQRQMFDLNARKETHLHVTSCFMLVVNKCTGQVRERVMEFNEQFAIDFQSIADAPLGDPLALREVVNDSCLACPLRMDCETYEAHADGV